VAIKIIKKKEVAKSIITEDMMSNELLALTKLSHPNILRIYELLHNDKNYYIVSELIKHGHLKDLVENTKKNGERLQESQIIAITKQLFQVLNFMHKQKYLHRDLKPENILLDLTDEENVQIKVSDFGFATY